MRARQAAEALFATRRQVTPQSVPDSVPLARRKPRVLRALAPAPVSPEERKPPIGSEQRVTPEPGSQFVRIPAQVAAVYGVAVDVIERILAQT